MIVEETPQAMDAFIPVVHFATRHRSTHGEEKALMDWDAFAGEQCPERSVK
jgi:hypothetical protein